MKKTIPWALTWFMALMMVFSVNAKGQEVIAYWDQNSNDLPGGGFGFLASPDAFPQSADLGVGSLTVGGGIISETETNTNDELIYTWIKSFGGTTVNAQDGVAGGGSISIQGGTDNGNNGAYLQLEISTEAYEDIILTYAAQSTGSGFDSHAWSWSTDGVAFTDVLTFTDIETSFANTGVITVELPETADDLETVYLRVTLTGATGATGNTRFDNLTVLGTEITEEPVDYQTLFTILGSDLNFGDRTERGIAAHGDNLYLASRSGGNNVKVFNRLTGIQTGTLNTTGITGGTFQLNDIETTEDGVILACNMAMGAAGIFKVYILDETNDAESIIELPTNGQRIGDKFTVVGSFDDGSARIYAIDGSGTKSVYHWSMIPAIDKNGFEFGEPSTITIDPATGASPVVTAKPDGTFFVTGTGQSIHKLNADGTLIGSIPGSIVPSGTSAMKYLGKEGNDEFLAIYNYGVDNEKIYVVKLPDGDPALTEVVFITPSIYVDGVNNPDGTGDVHYVAHLDGNVDLYILGTNHGIGGYTSANLNLEFPIYLPPAEEIAVARAQIIHNSADPAAALVDIFVNGEEFLTDFAFRTATPFVDIPAGVELTLDIAPAGQGIGASVGTFIVTLTEDETYVIVANGIIPENGDKEDISTDFSLFTYAEAREEADEATNTDVLVFHGSTDAPTVSVWVMGADAELFAFSYGEFQPYLELPIDDYVLEVRTEDGETVVATYVAPLDLLNLDGGAITVLASGFLTPGDDNAAFGLFAATAAGGALVELPVYEDPPLARAQIIHNSADPAAALVDVFVNGEEFLTNFAFRTATPFVDLPAGVELTIDIAPAEQGIGASVGTFPFTLTEDETYVIVANGIIPENGSKEDISTDFSLFPYAEAREEADAAANTDVLVFHGSTDAPTVSVWVMGDDAELFAFSYGEFQPYLELPTDDYVLEIRSEDGGTVVATYVAPLDFFNLDGAAITVLASGFLTPGDDNAAFGLFAATAAGGALIELPVYEEPAEAITLNMLLDRIGENLPAEIGSENNARSAALFQERYVVVPSREIGPNVWVWDSYNPHLDPFALDMGTDIIEPLTFPINYIRTTETAIYVSNLSLNPSGAGWGHGVFQIYRWTDLDATPEVVVSYDVLPGRLGDAFSIIGDPEDDGHIVAHINTTKEFRIWNFEGGVLLNEDTPDLFTLDVEFTHINNHGIINPIEGEDDIFVLTSNNIGIMIVNLDGDVLAHMGTDVIDMSSYDPNIFYHNGNRYLSYTINNDANTEVGARHQIVDISIGETVVEAIEMISSSWDLANRIVYDKVMGPGKKDHLTATNQVAFDENGEIIILAHVAATGFVLETTGALPATYTLTVEAEPAEGGTVTGGGEYYEGSTVPVTANAAIGYEFVNWTEGTDVVSTDADFHFTMPAEATTLVANFDLIPITDVATLAELRNLPADGTFYRYTGDAVIVAMDGFRNRKFLQDATAAILIFDQPGIITTEFDLYDVITDVVGVLHVQNQMLQFQPRFDAEPATENTPVDPYDFTIDGITSADQAKLVKLHNVTFTNVTDGQVFANGQNYTITDGENTLTVRTDFWNVDYIGEEIPVTPINLTGVVIQFNNNLQLVPRFEADFAEIFAVTFNVNMSTADGFDPETDVVYMTGSMLGWAEPGNDPANQTMERVGDTWIWTNTLELEAGTYEYKYFLNAGWDGGEWGGGDNRSVTVAADMTVNDVWGTMDPVFELTLVADPDNAGTVSGAGLYEEGEQVSLSAVAETGFLFVNWTDADDDVVSTEADFTYTMAAMPVVLTANFEVQPSVGDFAAIDINVFPNPARDNFKITANSTIRSIEITDLAGKMVYNDIINDTETSINNYFETGIYIVRILTDEGVFVRKLQIQK